MNLLIIYLTFARIGLFTIGGGLAALPLLHAEIVGGGWISEELFVDMLAVSQSTPGPIGINMSTYAGYTAAWIPGAVVATLGMVTPSLVIIILIAKFMRNFAQNPYTVAVLGSLRPTAVGLIAAAGWFVLSRAVFSGGTHLIGDFHIDMRAAALALALTGVHWRTRVHPVLIILGGGLAGMLLF